MWSLEVINYLNRQTGKTARKRGVLPAGPENVENWPRFHSQRWETTTRQVGSRLKAGSAIKPDGVVTGRHDEPALTWEQLKRQLQEYIAENPGHGFAITEEGQFQLYITAFCPVEDHHEKVHQDL